MLTLLVEVYSIQLALDYLNTTLHFLVGQEWLVSVLKFLMKGMQEMAEELLFTGQNIFQKINL